MNRDDTASQGQARNEASLPSGAREGTPPGRRPGRNPQARAEPENVAVQPIKNRPRAETPQSASATPLATDASRYRAGVVPDQCLNAVQNAPVELYPTSYVIAATPSRVVASSRAACFIRSSRR